MATHVVELQVIRFCKVYIEDEQNSMSEDEILKKAREQALSSDPDTILDQEMSEIEPDDIRSASLLYDLDD